MRNAKITDLLTSDGELLPVIEQRRTSNSFEMGAWVITWNEASRHIARTVKRAATLRVLHALPEFLNFETFRRVDQAKLAADLELAQASISRAVNELHDRGVLEREGKGPVTLWRFSLNYGFKGNLESFKAARRKRGWDTVAPLGRATPPVVAEAIDRKPGPAAAAGENSRQTRLRLLSEVRRTPRAAEPETHGNV